LFTVATHLLASSSRILHEERFDRLVHAMAQLPDEVNLRIAGDGPARGGLELLAKAYGVQDRVEFVSGISAKSDGTVVFPSAANLETAPIRPNGNRPAVGFASATGVRGVSSMAEFLHAVAPGAPCAVSRGDDSVLAEHRIALLTNRPTHYRVPLWNGLSERLSAAGASLRVLCTAAKSDHRTYMSLGEARFDQIWLKNRKAGGVDVPLDLERRLRDFRPSMVLSPGFSPTTTARAAAWAVRRGVPFGLWSGEIPALPTARSRIRRPHRRWTMKQASFALCYGSVAADYVHLLHPALPGVIARNTTPVPAIRPSGFNGEGVTVLSVARALPGKRLDVLVDTFRSLHDRDCRLVVVGDGPALPALRQQARGLPNVEFLGAIASDSIGEIYASADAFAFPSQWDPFGLVLVEALGAGLPTVTATLPGSAGDLAVDGHNCLAVAEDGSDRWRARLTTLIDDSALRTRLGDEAVRTIGSRWTMDHSVDAWVAGLRLGALVARAGNA
jgi:glycosyltransferase involved in cell wall biosynthesis